MKSILMLHGINHDMFGKRDPKQYGTITLAEIDTRLQALDHGPADGPPCAGGTPGTLEGARSQ